MDLPGLDLPDYLTRHPDGNVVLTGFRIGLLDIVRDFWEGMSPEQMALEYDLPSLAQLYKVVGFYLDNRPRIDEAKERCGIARHDRQRLVANGRRRVRFRSRDRRGVDQGGHVPSDRIRRIRTDRRTIEQI